MVRSTRRDILRAGVGLAGSAVAGCTGGPGAAADGGQRGLTVRSSFYVMADFARHVTGDDATVETLVPFGQHGHGWEPGPDIQRDVLTADVFIVVGEGFQPWADDIVDNVRGGDADVAVIEAWDGIELLEVGSERDGHAEDDGDHEHEHEDRDGTGEAGHEHGTVDPHFWLDLERAQLAVENIRDGLTDVEPDRADTFADNGATYADRLAALDRTFESALEGRRKDTVLIAGHDSYRYLGARYGFGIEALTGVSPDATPSPRDVARVQTIIDEHDIEYILAPVFESDRAANQFVEETAAREALPITPIPTLTAEWVEGGWGFVEVMENVNLESLERALEAT